MSSGPQYGGPEDGASQPPVCPRHPDQISYVRCQRCGRPVCPSCQRPASVGIQCVDCVHEGQRQTPAVRSIFGGRATDGRPMVTMVIIGLCVLIYLGQLFDDRVTTDLMYVPVLGQERPWTFISAAFVHSPSSFMHIAFNMYALWICGQYLEPMLGRARFVALYLLSALGGSVGYEAFAAVTDPGRQGSAWLTPTVGASGAVFGLFAAVVVLNRHLGRETGPMLVMIAINAAIPFFVPGIAWQAHVGGAIVGAICAGVIAALRGRGSQAQWAGLGAVFVVLVGLAVTMDRVGTQAFIGG